MICLDIIGLTNGGGIVSPPIGGKNPSRIRTRANNNYPTPTNAVVPCHISPTLSSVRTKPFCHLCSHCAYVNRTMPTPSETSSPAPHLFVPCLADPLQRLRGSEPHG